MSRIAFLLGGVAVLLAACTRSDSAVSDTGAASAAAGVTYAYERVPLDTTRRPGAVIDSVFPMPEMIRRFREGLPATDRFTGGASSRDALVQAFVRALAAQDTTTLGRLTLSRAEFAYLYLPNVPELTRANGLPPQRQWDQLVLSSEKGITRALDRLGRRSLALSTLTCPEAPVRMGIVEQQAGCVVKVIAPDAVGFDGRLFGSIVQIGGQYKFVSYANDM